MLHAFLREVVVVVASEIWVLWLQSTLRHQIPDRTTVAGVEISTDDHWNLRSMVVAQ